MDGYGDKNARAEKLSTLVTKIGYPRKWKSYSKLAMQEDSYVQNIIRLNVFHFKYEISKSRQAARQSRMAYVTRDRKRVL